MFCFFLKVKGDDSVLFSKKRHLHDSFLLVHLFPSFLQNDIFGVGDIRTRAGSVHDEFEPSKTSVMTRMRVRIRRRSQIADH